MMTCLETPWHICSDLASLKTPRSSASTGLRAPAVPGGLCSCLRLRKSPESACGSLSTASEGRKKCWPRISRGFQGIKERKANTEGKCAIYSWNKVTLAAFSSPVMLVFLKGLHTRLLPPLGFNHHSAPDLQLLSPTPSQPSFQFSPRLGKN